MSNISLPSINSQGSLQKYLKEIQKVKQDFLKK